MVFLALLAGHRMTVVELPWLAAPIEAIRASREAVQVIDGWGEDYRGVWRGGRFHVVERRRAGQARFSTPSFGGTVDLLPRGGYVGTLRKTNLEGGVRPPQPKVKLPGESLIFSGNWVLSTSNAAFQPAGFRAVEKRLGPCDGFACDARGRMFGYVTHSGTYALAQGSWVRISKEDAVCATNGRTSIFASGGHAGDNLVVKIFDHRTGFMKAVSTTKPGASQAIQAAYLDDTGQGFWLITEDSVYRGSPTNLRRVAEAGASFTASWMDRATLYVGERSGEISAIRR